MIYSMRLVLASSSPRRKELLKQVGIPFEIMIPDVDESNISGTPEQVVKKLSFKKACAVKNKLYDNDILILAADTVVSLDGIILNKPIDVYDAFAMLSKLSGRVHEVYTGVCLMWTGSPHAKTFVEKTKVFFKSLSEAEINDYIDSGEPMDKAGAYGIQEKGALFVERIEGDYNNVVGLPVCAVHKMIEKMCMAHVLGDIGEVSMKDIENDDYYIRGDYIGKQGIEKSYESYLRGEKGVEVLLRDAHGRIQGHYMDGKYDKRPIPGKNLKLGIDIDLQMLGERLLKNKIGSIVAIEPETGEILCMVSSPDFDPRLMIGRQRGKNHLMLQRDPMKPLLNRSIMGVYPPGSTFKTAQALTFLQEGIIQTNTPAFPCAHGFNYGSLHVGCHAHGSPLPLIPAIATSCNSYFCWGLFRMFGDRKYGSSQNAITVWKDHMVSQGFGYKLGVDLPGEKRGLIPNAQFYDKAYRGRWNGLTVISIAIGQGEILATPLQIANLGATIANRGHFITPHIVKEIQDEQLDSLYRVPRKTSIDRKHYEDVVTGMRAAVTGGTCRVAGAILPDVEVCGKTGTAQNRGHDHSVFMGFAPMNNPKIAIAVYVENGGFGAVYGVPIGALMMEQYLKGKLSPENEIRAEEYSNRVIMYGNEER